MIERRIDGQVRNSFKNYDTLNFYHIIVEFKELIRGNSVVGNIILTMNIRVMTQSLTSEDKDFNHIFPNIDA
jgi:hypothetical protein